MRCPESSGLGAAYNTGFTTTVTNPRGYSTTTSYLAYDQPGTDWPLVINAPESATTTIARDTFGKPTSLTRSGGGVTPVVRSYAYYATQELCRTEEPETKATHFGYDNAGNLVWSAAGVATGTACDNTGTTSVIAARKVSRSYDNRNRLLTLAFPDSNGNQTWTYTPDGLPSTVTTNNGGNAVANGYTYNRRRLLSGESMQPDTVATGWGIGYGYNGLGQVTSETYPANVSVSYTVNALGQATQVQASSDGGAATTIASAGSYYPNGALKQFTYGNGIVHTMTQNARQLPSQSVDGTVLNLTTTFDANGNVSAITDGTAAARQTRSMVYDQLDRLTGTTSPMFGTASYVYDTLDNLKQVSVSGGTGARNHYYCYNAANQLEFVRSGSNCSSSPSVINISYDVQGNLLQKTGTSGGTYTFDYGNRLRTVVAPSAPTTTYNYRYDADGRRVRQDIAGASLKYSYYAKDGRILWQRDEPNSKRISNLYFAGSLVAEYSRPIGSTAVTISYLHTDALGSPIAKTDASKAVIETSEYEPYGDLLNRANDDRAGYTGHVMDAASGLTYMQQRYYDPQIGVFLSVDPVTASGNPVGQFHRNRYANNNPYSFTDPDGRFADEQSPEYIRREEERKEEIKRIRMQEIRNKSDSLGGGIDSRYTVSATSVESKDQLVRKWKISRASAKGGVLLQEMTIDYYLVDSDGGILQGNKLFWEGWKVSAGKAATHPSADFFKPATTGYIRGWIVWTARAAFFEGAQMPSGMKPNGTAWAGQAYSTDVDPNIDWSKGSNQVIIQWSWPP